MRWMHKYIPIICIAFALLAGAFVVVAWGIGYFFNGLYGFKFELSSCKEIMLAMGIGLVGILTWIINSVYNSPKGEPPKCE